MNDEYYNISFDKINAKVTTLAIELNIAEAKYDAALKTFQPDTVVFESGLDIQNIKRKLKYFSERISKMQG